MPELDDFETRFASAYRWYLTEVPTEVDAWAVAHAIAVAHPRRRLTRPWIGWNGAAWPRPALLLLVVALVTALVGGLLFVGARWIERPPALPRDATALVPTGIDVLTPEGGSYTRMVADGAGILWARDETGWLLRFDPATQTARTWSIGDDAAFAMSDIAPAAAGGVWLIDGPTLRWFDGERFVDVVVAPVELAVAVEAPDAGLWAATWDGAVLHWDGSTWGRSDPVRPNPDATVSAIAVDPAGHPWIGWQQYGESGGSGAGWVSRYDGSGWATFHPADAAPLGGAVWSIAHLPDGAAWVATGTGLARFDGSSWTDVAATWTGDRSTTSVTAGPDGTIWVAAGDPDDGAVTVRRFDGRSWVTYGAADGLPGPNENGNVAVWVAPTDDDAYIATGAGMFRLTAGLWQRAWPLTPSTVERTALLAVSRDELWARGDSGVWRYRDGDWTKERIDPGRVPGVVSDLTLAPDGTLWAAGTDGVAYRRDGHWTIVDASPASAIEVDGGGTVWVGGRGQVEARAKECEVRTLRSDGGAWVTEALTGCPLPSGRPAETLAVDANGSVWIGNPLGWLPASGGLARFDGRDWQSIPRIGGLAVDGATVLGKIPTGGVWIAVQTAATDLPIVRAARFDGSDWTLVELPADSWNPVAAPDGTLWAPTGRGPARYDGQRWTLPYAKPLSRWIDVDAVAPDGTVFGSIGPTIVRFPAVVPER